MRRCGVHPPLRLEAADGDYLASHIDAHLLERDGERAVIVTNEGVVDTALTVGLSGLRAASAFDPFSGAPVPLESGSEANVALQLAATDAAVILFQGVEPEA